MLVCSAVSALVGCTINKHVFRKAYVEMGMVTVFLIGANISGGALSVVGTSPGFRIRGQAINTVLWKASPGMFGFPRFHSAVLILVSVLLDFAQLEAFRILYQDPVALKEGVNSLIYAFGFLGVAWMSAGRLWSIYDAQEALGVEKLLMESIISMMCDGTVWLSENGCTILRADQRFTTVIGKDIVGMHISEVLAGEERQRLQNRLADAKSAPVLLPTTLVNQVGNKISVEMFIVGNRDIKKQGDTALIPAFLIGMRMYADSLPTYNEVPLKQEHVQLLASASLAEQTVQEDRQSAHSLPETNFTGRIFSGMDAALELAERPPDESTDAGVMALLDKVLRLGRQQRWLMSADEVIMAPNQVLGQGSFGLVFSGWLHGSPVAVKTTLRSRDNAGVKHLVASANEIRILRHVRHPNVVLFHGACVEPAKGELMLVLERVMGPDLYRYVSTHSSDAEVFGRFQLLLDVACALRYLHAQRPQVVHGDLKGSNVLVELSGPRAKIIDFGLSRLLTRHARPLGGTLDWMAPEVISKRTSMPRASADVFSFGRLAYMVVACSKPLAGVKNQAIIDMAKRGAMPALAWEDGRPLHEECSALCRRLANFDPQLRPTMATAHREVSSWTLPGFEERMPALPLSKAMSDGGELEHLEAREDGDAEAQGVEAAGGSEAALGAGSMGLQLALPALLPTDEDVKKLTVLDAAMQWNFRVPPSSCCRYHAAMLELERVVSELSRGGCSEAFAPHSTSQCRSCGVLDVQAGRYCSFCDRSVSHSQLLSIQEEQEERGSPYSVGSHNSSMLCSL